MNYLATIHKDLSLIGRRVFKTSPYLGKHIQGSGPPSPMMTHLIPEGVWGHKY